MLASALTARFDILCFWLTPGRESKSHNYILSKVPVSISEDQKHPSKYFMLILLRYVLHQI